MQRTRMKWLHMLAGMALIFLYACGGGGGDNGPVVIFTDDFSTDTTGEYTTVDVPLNGPPLTVPEFNWDAVGKRVQVLTGNNVGLTFSQDFPAPAINNGVFSFDFYPTQSYPTHGGLWVRLMQDADNYYEMVVFDWGAEIPFETPYFAKVVGGVTVDIVTFTNISNYVSQDPPTQYPVTITITPALASVQGFGENIELDFDNTPIDIVKFEIQTNQQDAYYDNLMFIPVP